MVKKISKLADADAPQAKANPKSSGSGLLDSQLAQTIKDSAQQIWLAGLGAFAKAQGEGSKVFDSLIKEGSSLHRKSQAAAEQKLGDMASKVSAMAGEVGQKANAQWDKLETIFEERTARALRSLGVPTAKDLADLNARVDALAKAAAAGPMAKPLAKPLAKPRAKRPRQPSVANVATAASVVAAAPEAATAEVAAPKKRRARKPAAAT